MIEASTKSIAIIVAAITVSVSILGLGYAMNYSGSTSASSDTFYVKYVVIEVDGDSPSAITNTFYFPAPKYFADTTISDSTVTTYRHASYNGTSQAVELHITGANTTNLDVDAKLTRSLPANVTATIQLYSSVENDGAHVISDAIGSAKDLTTEGFDDLWELVCGSYYYCMVTLSIPTSAQLDPTNTHIDLDVTFTASATIETED